MPAPQEPTSVEPAWLTDQLTAAGVLTGGRVAEVQAEPMGKSIGFLSRMARLTLVYEGDADRAPEHLILKLQPVDPNFTKVADRLRAFDREYGFYRELASRVPTRLPVFYAGHSIGGKGWLLMEDLSRLEKGNQVHGLTNDQVSRTLSHMAAVHATHWESTTLSELDWLPDHDFWFREELADTWPVFKEHYQLRIGSRGTALVEAVIGGQDALYARIAERTSTLVHGDLRADNLLLGEVGTEDEVLILDWQTVTQGLAAIDVAMLIGGSDPPAERVGHYREILKHWHAELERNGVTDYSFSDAEYDLRLALLACLTIPVQTFRELGGPNFRNAREAQLADCFILRHTSAAIDFDADAIL